MPHFHYCLLTWGSTITTGHKLHLLQKKALRLIDNSYYIAHTEPIFKQNYTWLKLLICLASQCGNFIIN